MKEFSLQSVEDLGSDAFEFNDSSISESSFSDDSTTDIDEDDSLIATVSPELICENFENEEDADEEQSIREVEPELKHNAEEQIGGQRRNTNWIAPVMKPPTLKVFHHEEFAELQGRIRGQTRSYVCFDQKEFNRQLQQEGALRRRDQDPDSISTHDDDNPGPLRKPREVVQKSIPPDVSNIASANKQYKAVVSELVQTERDYIRDLQTIINVCYLSSHSKIEQFS